MSLENDSQTISKSGFSIGNRLIGDGHPPLLVPDIGTFFNQDVGQAVELVDILKESGAEIVKGEILHDADICLPNSIDETYLSSTTGMPVREPYRDLIERKTVPLDSYARIFQSCTRAGIDFVVSVYDFAGTDFAVETGAAAIKVASSNIVHDPLIRHIARTGKPVLIDTGKSTMAEIARAISWAADEGARDILVQYSPPPPPAPVSSQNLRVLDTFSSAFGRPVGLSDHHAGPEMLFAAAARGVPLLEKGVCPDDLEDDQDVAHAMRVSDFKWIQKTCQTIYEGLGDGVLPPVTSKKMSRMGLVASCDIRSGEPLTLDNVTFAFPAFGIPVEEWSNMEGKTVTSSISAGQLIRRDHVDGLAE